MQNNPNSGIDFLTNQASSFGFWRNACEWCVAGRIKSFIEPPAARGPQFAHLCLSWFVAVRSLSGDQGRARSSARARLVMMGRLLKVQLAGRHCKGFVVVPSVCVCAVQRKRNDNGPLSHSSLH